MRKTKDRRHRHRLHGFRIGPSEGFLRAAYACALVLLTGVVPVLDAQAPDSGLYGSGAPEGAAFVRVVNASAGGEAVRTAIGDAAFDEIEPLSASRYAAVTPGIYRVMIDGRSEEIIPREGRYYTVGYSGSGITIFEDEEHTAPHLAQIFLYNLTGSGPISLRTADGSVAVVPDVGEGDSGVAEVNPVPVELEVFLGGESIGTAGDPGLERGGSFSVFAVESGGEPHVFVSRAEIRTE